MERKEAEITINVPAGGDCSYYITLKGKRVDILKSICSIYGGYLSEYDVAQWYDRSKQPKEA